MAALLSILTSSVSFVDSGKTILKLISSSGRFPLAFQCIPALILSVGALFLHESPRFLIDKNRFDEARASLRKFHGHGDNDDFLETEFNEIKQSIALEREANATTWASLIANPSARKKLLLGCGAQFFCQTSGLNVIAYYGMWEIHLTSIQLLMNISRTSHIRHARHQHSNIINDHWNQRHTRSHLYHYCTRLP